jgi:lysophospholipase L1-like esterase
MKPRCHCAGLRRWRRWLLSMVVFCAPLGALAQGPSGDFALQDRDTVVFLGDSNTQWGSYPKDVENYTVLRYPGRRIRFVNAGLDGDMTSRAYFRLDRDVFGAGATVVFVLLGINDISWGNYADSTFRQTFLDYTVKIVDACRDHHVRVYVLSYPVTAAAVGVKANDPYSRFLGSLSATDTSLLQRLGDQAMSLARAHGALTIDIQREMRRIVEAAPKGTRFHQDDGVHLNEFGNQALGFALLRGLGAPRQVSSVEIDAKNLKVTAESTVVTAVKRNGETLEFTRLDHALPLTFWTPLERSGASMERIFEPINGFFLTFRNLPQGSRFELKVDGIVMSPGCGFRTDELGRRLNLATLSSSYYSPRGPWAHQAIALGRITESKADLEVALFYQRQNELRTDGWPLMRARIVASLESASEAQKVIGQPHPYHYTLSRLPADSAARCAPAR